MYLPKLVALTAAVSFACLCSAAAQTSPTAPPASTMSKATETPPLPGANSFTEGQAKDRMEEAGFTQVSNLKKDDNGIWRGSAMKDGKQVSVALDFRGNVVATQ
jgi:putative membrane protein